LKDLDRAHVENPTVSSTTFTWHRVAVVDVAEVTVVPVVLVVVVVAVDALHTPELPSSTVSNNRLRTASSSGKGTSKMPNLLMSPAKFNKSAVFDENPPPPD
jgi:hypothetical protein